MWFIESFIIKSFIELFSFLLVAFPIIVIIFNQHLITTVVICVYVHMFIIVHIVILLLIYI